MKHVVISLGGIAATSIKFRVPLVVMLLDGATPDWDEAESLLSGTEAEKSKQLDKILKCVKKILRDNWKVFEAIVTETIKKGGWGYGLTMDAEAVNGLRDHGALPPLPFFPSKLRKRPANRIYQLFGMQWTMPA
jgi:hypothetical protein